MFELRTYQRTTLAKLQEFFEAASEHGPRAAFILKTNRPYHEVPGLVDAPYICIRVPTGGGKTFMAACSVGIAAHEYLQRQIALCLWLVPSNAILDQTLQRLKDRSDPYRLALEEAFGERVQVMDMREALTLQRATLANEAVVVVSTLAAIRVEDTEGRKAYEANGSLQHHFTGLGPQELDFLEAANGVVIPSLANVLRLHRPIIIVDEAHNARTGLSFEALARVSPSAIIEFTATPALEHRPERGEIASNVLAHVSAAELKAEEMVKLPVKLVTRTTWTESVADAVSLQRNLERIAGDERRDTGEYIRPIVLFQAQPHRQGQETIHAEALKAALVQDFNIAAEHIAIATGAIRELDGVDINAEHCGVRFIITQQALREGWDCPMAYVLCSIADTSSPRAIEQLLGRVLRMPRARRKRSPDLNCAYAIAVSSEFARVAGTLADALIENGFQRLEAADLVVDADQLDDLPLFGGSLYASVSARVDEAPVLGGLTESFRARVSYDDATGHLTVTGGLTEAERDSLQNAFQSEAGKAAADGLYRRSHGFGVQKVKEKAAALVMPSLALRSAGALELLTDSHFLDAEWKLPETAQLDGTALTPGFANVGEVDVDERGQITMVATPDAQLPPVLPFAETGWTLPQLAVWIDRQVPHPDLSQIEVSAFILRLLQRLQAAGQPVEVLARMKFRLRKQVARLIDDVRAKRKAETFQAMLFGPSADMLTTDPSVGILLDQDRYAPNWYYEGAYQFQKHMFRRIGELKSSGEEFTCAVHIDQHPNVDVWVRNIASFPRGGFWLPVPRGRFFPDFVGRLLDGRLFVVEYKGNHLWGSDDTAAKRAVGEVWAERSAGSCLFVMPRPVQWQDVQAGLAQTE